MRKAVSSDPARRAFLLAGLVMLALSVPTTPAAAPEPAERVQQEIDTLKQRLLELTHAEATATTDEQRTDAAEKRHRVERRLQTLKQLMAVLDPTQGVDADGESIVEEITVTATTSALPSSRAPIPTQVVTREEIDALATEDIENVLETVPGIIVQRNTAFSLGATTVSMQGAAPDQVAILMDGKPFVGGVDGVVDLRDIPVTNIERIEVVRGPGSALYGSQAMAGVINIITKEGGQTSGNFSLGVGSFDQRLLNAAFGDGVGKVNYFVSGQAGTFKPAQQWGDDFSTQLQPSDQQDRGQLFASVDIPVGSHRVDLSASYLEEQNPNSYNRNPALHAGWTKDFGPTSQLKVTLDQHSFFRRNDFEGLEEERDYDDQRAETRYKKGFLGHPFWQNHLLTAGYRLRRELLQSPALGAGEGDLAPEPIDEEVDQHTVYLQDEIFIGQSWSIAATVGVDDHELYGAQTSPRLAVAWLPSPQARLSVSWGRGFRAPNLLQLYDKDVNIPFPSNPALGYQIVGNPNLLPETNEAWNVQFDYTGRWARGFVHTYRTRYEDLITTQFVGLDPTTFSYINIAGARTSSSATTPGSIGESVPTKRVEPGHSASTRWTTARATRVSAAGSTATASATGNPTGPGVPCPDGSTRSATTTT